MAPKMELVQVNPIGTDVQITGDHLVALLVSQVEEQLSEKDRDLTQHLRDLNSQLDKVNKQYEEAENKFEDDQSKKFKNLKIWQEMKNLGFKNVTHKIRISHYDFKDKKCHLYHHIKSDHGNMESVSSPIPIPQNLLKLQSQREELQSTISKTQSELISIRSSRQNDIPSLERWAKGRIAAQALQKAGGDMQNFLDKLSGNIPSNIKRLLEQK